MIKTVWGLATTAMLLAIFMLSATTGHAEVSIAQFAATGSSWNFGRSDDKNFDGWPDRWRRRQGVGYPTYVKIEIVARDTELDRQVRGLDTWLIQTWQSARSWFPQMPPLPPSVADHLVDRYLRIQLDGGQARVESEALPVNQMFQYEFTCTVKTEGLRHNTALAELVFLDENDQVVEVRPTSRVGGTTDWQTVQVPRLRPPSNAKQLVVRLVVERSEDGLEDIQGVIGFDNLRVVQYPQLQVVTDQLLGVYRKGQPIQATASVLGLPTNSSAVSFRLWSVDNEVLAERSIPIQPKNDRRGRDEVRTQQMESELSWQLPALECGFYRLEAELVGPSGFQLTTATTLAVIDQLVDGPPRGPFGWTLPRGRQNIPPRQLAPYLGNLGVAWVKYPAWLAPDDNARAEETAFLFKWMQDNHIKVVGMLDSPPEEELSRYNLRGRGDVHVAQLFREIEYWQPLLEPIMTRLTLRVQRWQLGAERDYSFLGRSRLNETIKEIAKGLQGYGAPIDVTISWPWLDPEIRVGGDAWKAVCRSSSPALSPQELDDYLKLQSRPTNPSAPKTWLLLDPLSKSQYKRDARITDLVLRMATTRNHDVEAAFVSDPRDPQTGLLGSDGRPDEMLLPWRTTARLLGDLRRVGDLQLRSGANCAVFAGDDRAVMMVWADEPTEDWLYLGENAQTVDVWGRANRLPVEQRDGQGVQHIEIGPVPRFLVDVDPLLLAFRMSVALNTEQIDSLLGQTQKISIRFTNPGRASLGGELKLVAPQHWSIDSPNRKWEAFGLRTEEHIFDVVLGNSARIGSYEIPLQFDIRTDPPKRITVYRNMRVGPDGLDVRVQTKVIGKELRVRVEMTNQSEQAQSYDCMLFPPPGRQYQRRFVTVGPGETVIRDTFWPDAESLIGQQMLLRATEQEGQRVLNYQVDVRR